SVSNSRVNAMSVLLVCGQPVAASFDPVEDLREVVEFAVADVGAARGVAGAGFAGLAHLLLDVADQVAGRALVAFDLAFGGTADVDDRVAVDGEAEAGGAGVLVSGDRQGELACCAPDVTAEGGQHLVGGDDGDLAQSADPAHGQQ